MIHKLIVIMLDGISADYFATCRDRMPHITALGANGLIVERLGAEVCGTSLPGRASMMTGARADASGIYGNRIWNGEEFRYASPYDVRVPTLAARATEAGCSVGVVGFGMLRPEDAHIFRAPWWTGGFVQRARDNTPIPASADWLRVVEYRDPHTQFADAVSAFGLPDEWPQTDGIDFNGRAMRAIVSDARTLDWMAALALSADAPDLIISEVLLTDTIQHYAGYKSDLAHWAISYADMLVGGLVARLRAANLLDRYHIAVMSDHGHAPIDRAIYPEIVIPDTIYQCEGSFLHVVPRSAAELDEITARLAEHGATRYNSDHLPAEQRAAVIPFLAPDDMSFEADLPFPISEPVGRPSAISSHGLRPGHPGDERFAVFAGPEITAARIDRADPAQVAPTLAHLLGLDVRGFAHEPIL